MTFSFELESSSFFWLQFAPMVCDGELIFPITVQYRMNQHPASITKIDIVRQTFEVCAHTVRAHDRHDTRENARKQFGLCAKTRTDLIKIKSTFIAAHSKLLRTVFCTLI